MKKEDFFEVLGELDDDIVKEAKQPIRKRVSWKVWRVMAACLCIAVGVTVLLTSRDLPPAVTGGGETDLGNDGMTYNYSVAVYPETEREENVDTAEIISHTEQETLENPLAEHLPKPLPEEFHYGRGSLYNTVMKDGTQYNMLRIEYITGEIPEPEFAEDGGEVVPDPKLLGDTFTVCVMNFEPKTDIKIYSSREEIDDITESTLEEAGAVYIRSGDHYVGVFMETADPVKVLEALQTIK